LAPALMSAGVLQINGLVGDLYASFLRDGSIAWLYYADRVQQLPLALVGIALSVALLPMIARLLNEGKGDQAKARLQDALMIAAALIFPAMMALVLIPDLVIETLFERGEFSSHDRMMTASALRIYALGLPAFVIVKCLAPVFYARHDTKTPMRLTIITVAVNALLALPLMQLYHHVGIACAFVAAAWCNAILHLVMILRCKMMPFFNGLGVWWFKLAAGLGVVVLIITCLQFWLSSLAAWLQLAFIIPSVLIGYGGFALITGMIRPSQRSM
ncbi:MAG: lipid II flippase MurJ, partial [Pseudomonadota bacterium]